VTRFGFRLARRRHQSGGHFSRPTVEPYANGSLIALNDTGETTRRAQSLIPPWRRAMTVKLPLFEVFALNKVRRE
jgi:hypothetical protein